MTLRKLSMQGVSIILVAIMLSSAIPASLAETGTNGLLGPLPHSSVIGNGMLRASHPHPFLPTVSLFDNFTTDSNLNTAMWTVNGSASKAVFLKEDPFIFVKQPILSFSNKSGMAMSGIFRDHRAASIQSVASFSTPFTAYTRVLGKLAHGNPFVFGISTSNGSQNLLIAGNLNSSNPAFGINYGPAGSAVQKLVSNPSVNVWYKLYINVNSTGYAKLTVLANGTVAGEATEKVGKGQYYLILGQYEANPPTSGPNKSFWKWVQLKTQGSSQPSQLFDQFTMDTSLNSTLWTINGAIGNTTFSQMAGPEAVIKQPILDFSNKSGMAMSGIFRDHRAASIQSVASFSTPFVASTRVLGKLSDGNPFVFGISTSNGSQNLMIAGNLNSSNPDYGINYGPAGGSSQKLVSNPLVGIWYNLYISVDSTGNAKLTVLSNGVVVGEATAKVGTGDYNILLGQFEKNPPLSGPNKSFWKWVEVKS